MRVHRAGPLWAYSRGWRLREQSAGRRNALTGRIVIAVDVGAAPETELLNYGDSLSGFWVLLRRLNPWAKPINIFINHLTYETI